MTCTYETRGIVTRYGRVHAGTVESAIAQIQYYFEVLILVLLQSTSKLKWYSGQVISAQVGHKVTLTSTQI